MSSEYHVPVLLQECIEGLNIKADGKYVDLTYGGGGHSKAILEKLGDSGVLYGFDQDPDAAKNVVQDSRLIFIPQNFRYAANFLKMYNPKGVDGVLADLGVSSHQFNDEKRGFSFRYDVKLDMRMDKNQKLDAVKVINEYPEEKLADVFYHYGEIRRSRHLAHEIVRKREEKSIVLVSELLEIAKKYAENHKESQFNARLFQAIRIEVNQEMDVLKEMLEGISKELKKGGRLVIMSYHSLEDRMVKNFFKTGNIEGKEQKDFFGNLIRPLKPLSSKVIVPTDIEIERNPRARSAKLRIAEKI